MQVHENILQRVYIASRRSTYSTVTSAGF